MIHNPVVMNSNGMNFLLLGFNSGKNNSGKKRNAWTKPREIAVKKLNSMGGTHSFLN